MKSSLYISGKPQFSNPIAKWAFSLISSIIGQTFVVYFTKRTTGEMRRMVCYYMENGPITRRNWNPSSKNLLNVWDIEKGAQRFISMDSVERIVIGGTAHMFEPLSDNDPVEPACDFVSFKAELQGMLY